MILTRTKLVLVCVCSHLLLMDSVHGGNFIGPESQVAFEGEISTFSCFSNGTLFWRINSEFYRHTDFDFFAQKGFSFFDSYSEGSVEVNRTLSIVGNQETNNTVINCVNVENNVVTVSENATFTVLGFPSGVVLSAVNMSTFRLVWNASSTPTGFEPHNYTVIAYNNNVRNQNTPETFTIQANDDDSMYSFYYRVEDSIDLLSLPLCSWYMFSLYSTNSYGSSLPVDRSWETSLAPGPIEDVRCSLMFNGDKDATAYVTFTIPKMCDFQTAIYSYNLSLAETNSSPEAVSEKKAYSGSDEQSIEGQFPGLKIRSMLFYRLSVTVVLSETDVVITATEICSPTTGHFTTPAVGSLAPGSSSGGFTAWAVICGLVLMAVIICNGILCVAIYIYVRRRHH